MGNNKRTMTFNDLKVGDRVKTRYSGWATVTQVGCYSGNMVKLNCDEIRETLTSYNLNIES
jgi:hypothetical protein